MSEEDFYAILGVSEEASFDEIKKSYRKLCLQHHPDRNGDAEVFKKINEAYETLGDTEKKQEYDMSKQNPFMRMNTMGGGEGNIDDLLSKLFFGGMMQQQGMGGMHGMMGGGMFPQGSNIHVFRNGVQVNMSREQEKPQAIIKKLVINMELVLNGGKIPIELERWIIEGENKVFENVTLYVDIIKGIDHNEMILLKDEGNVINSKCKGDIKLFIHIKNDTLFERKGLDLLIHKEISLKEALCGFSFELKYINGKVYTINNHAGNIISPEFQKVIQNMGLTRDKHVGNLIIFFHLKFPETISLENIEKLKEIF